MSRFPDRAEQIRTVHAAFIRQVVETCQAPDTRPVFEQLLAAAEEQGWTELCARLRRIGAGERGAGLLAGLDEEDGIIVESVLAGLADPRTLPDPERARDATLAAPGLAHMIHVARSDPKALALLGNMAQQMQQVGGPMARLSGAIRPLVNGERDPDRLCRGMDTATEQLLLDILRELGQLERH